MLVEAIKSEISGFSVQWRLINNSKPHVVFKLQFRQKIQTGTKKYSACLLFMSRPPSAGGARFYIPQDQLDRAPVITLVPDTPASDDSVSSVAFKFAVHGRWTLHDVTKVIWGQVRRLAAGHEQRFERLPVYVAETTYRSDDGRSIVD
jgi:hypothetical protein